MGNVEVRTSSRAKVADVIVCDGFVGNTVLKMAEGLYHINKKLGGGNAFWDAMNYENVGGTPVLGVNAPVVIGHGISSPGDQEHDPFDGAVHQGGPYRQTAACFQKLITH